LPVADLDAAHPKHPTASDFKVLLIGVRPAVAPFIRGLENHRSSAMFTPRWRPNAAPSCKVLSFARL